MGSIVQVVGDNGIRTILEQKVFAVIYLMNIPFAPQHIANAQIHLKVLQISGL